MAVISAPFAFFQPNEATASTDLTGVELVYRAGRAFQRTTGSTRAASDDVLLDSQGARFEASTLRRPFAVKAVNRNDPPSNPVQGDRYIVGTGTGAWLNRDGDIAEFDGNYGWQFYAMNTQTIGFRIYNEADSQNWYYSNTGWAQGVPASELTDGSIDITKQKNPSRVTVQGILNAQPFGSADTDIIVGLTPTGVLAGRRNSIGHRRAGVWTFTAPFKGMTARVVTATTTRNYNFDGTKWDDVGGSPVVIGYHTSVFSPGQFLDTPVPVVPIAFDTPPGEQAIRSIDLSDSSTWLEIDIEELAIVYTTTGTGSTTRFQFVFQIRVGTTTVVDLWTNEGEFRRPDGTFAGQVNRLYYGATQRAMLAEGGHFARLRLADYGALGQAVTMRMGIRQRFDPNAANPWLDNLDSPDTGLRLSVEAASGRVIIREIAN